ncbi:helix-turn-helix domain-containing protein [Clostridium pasteurianum DSM 525 = ATCC 6013]|uniref:Helix-turn-helix domain-containing protein n=1 Tax=Clostridium pasteurianum DSM 525 = ATCC 6013 TaxID=1262449 RepID=A0A0H3J8L5_CLOPA|nr:helix-turn-helix domain-containing protein [Clostridium pasteurianum]AJA49809.1 helix-turn-helix domain-containing protein [Clostridium pasteurianum DSM 525 = ATCC 6013]AJA53797.1 helix-turn-helix domain-containing protein [Clostridium pasteurianum DSM 525 = ATCC 6013]KRU14178.1 Transposase IS30-like HTH domain containing protein [Clostridium pasteurianum DSM 525 = ATCC 6013]
MTRYREILRLYNQGISQRSIALSCECSRNTVSRTLKRAEACGIGWPLPQDMSDDELIKNFFHNEFSLLQEDFQTVSISTRKWLKVV